MLIVIVCLWLLGATVKGTHSIANNTKERVQCVSASSTCPFTSP